MYFHWTRLHLTSNPFASPASSTNVTPIIYMNILSNIQHNPLKPWVWTTVLWDHNASIQIQISKNMAGPHSWCQTRSFLQSKKNLRYGRHVKLGRVLPAKINSKLSIWMPQHTKTSFRVKCSALEYLSHSNSKHRQQNNTLFYSS